MKAPVFPERRDGTVGSAVHRLLDGTEVTVRAMGPADADALVRFHEALSPESRRLRFFVVHPHLSAEELRRFTTVDHRDREALVVVVGSEILGVGRYDRLADATVAEVAFVTRDDHQGSGIATLLFHEVAAAARAAGITRFVAETLPENHRMLGVFAATGLVSGRSFDDGAVEVTMSLDEGSVAVAASAGPIRGPAARPSTRCSQRPPPASPTM